MASAPITDYASLQDAIVRYIDDTDIANEAASCIMQAEAEFRRLLVMPDMELQVSFTPGAGVPVPADFDSARSMMLLGDCRQVIEPLSPADFYSRPADIVGGPYYYAIIAENFLFSPTPDASASAVLTYLASLPALNNSNTTNWLLKKHPDVYLMGSLLQAEFFGWNDDRLPIIKARLEEIVDQVNMAGNRNRYGSGPIQMRPPVQENLRWAQGRGLIRW